MKRIINIRGCNASGKTTTVREFIKQFPNAQIGQVAGSYVTRCTPKIFVLGRYDKKNGGCDGYSGTAEVISAIDALIKTFHPEVIIYEGMLYSKTAKFAQDVANRFISAGYSWTGILLHRELKSIFSLLEARNGGARYDVRTIINTYNGCESSYKTLAARGMDIKRIDVDGLPFEQMKEILNGAIYDT